jgi:LmbE family N-acetylglucosaminyl deacetylase
MKKTLVIIILFLTPLFSIAQQVRPASSAQIYHELNQLKNLASVLYLAAHPDDENTRMLGWLVNEQHIPTAYLSITRGDGGQNILGPHLGPALGLIRTHELLEARKLDGGAGQYFTRAVDFGFSKTSEETFKHWDEKTLTGDVVWVMRQFRPDVVICRFPPTAQAGHGQHAASAILGHKAFTVAGSRDAYKEHFKHLQPWQPKRILFNAYRFGDRNTTSDKQFKLEVGQYNSLLGMGYGELAGISRSIHRSQGAGTRSIPGVQTEYLQLVDGAPFDSSIFDGIDITWGRVGRKDIGEKIESIINAYDFTHPEKSLPALLSLYKEVKNMGENEWKSRKLQELKDLILHTSGFMIEIITDKPEVVRGENVPFTINAIARSGAVKVKLLDIECLASDTVCHLFMPADELVTIKRSIRIPANIPYTEPYWLAEPQKDDAHYTIPQQEYLGLPLTPNSLVATTRVQVADETFLVEVPLSYKTLDATHGDVVEPLRVAPVVTLKFTEEMVTLLADGSVRANLQVSTAVKLQSARLVVMAKGYVDTIQLADIMPGTITVPVAAPSGKLDFSHGKAQVNVALVSEGIVYNKQQHTIKYEHLPTLRYYTQPAVQVIPQNWQSKALKVAYIPGAGDDVAEALRFAGVHVDILKDADINRSNLARYDAVIVGIRAINVNEKAAVWMPELLGYTENGGTLVMQYNTNHRLETDNIGPYLIKLGRGRVTEEDAKVEVLAKDHRLLTYPNMISPADFDGWVQERGLYFADTWDEHYTPLFSMNDTGEQPLKGSTLYTAYGNGHYIYTSLSFFRQLPAGNVGAIRLLLNFIAVGK